MDISISVPAFIFLMLGWTFCFITGGFMFIISRWTPAFTFLWAWFKRRPIAYVKYRHGMSAFKIGDIKYPGCMEVKNVGSVLMSEGSHLFETKSKVPIYEMFSEYGATLPKEYQPIITELRDAGLEINNWEDYKHLIDLANNKKYEEDFLKSLKV